jgi:SnoaL-like domain
MTDEDRAYLAIQRLQRAYADVATRGAWPEVVSLLAPDCHITFDTRSAQILEVSGADEFAQFAAKMTAAFSFYELVPQNFVVTIGPGGTAGGRSYSLEVGEDAKTGEWLEFYGVFSDEYILLDDEWRFSRRHYQTYARRRDGSLESFKLTGGSFDTSK